MMGIDAKDVQLLICRVAGFSISTCSKFVRKYPLVAGVVFLLLVLYLFLPSVLYFLFYSSPFLISTAVFIRFYLNSTSPRVRAAAKDEKKKNGILSSGESHSHVAELVFDRNEKSSSQNQAIMQRNVEGRSEEPGAVAVDKVKGADLMNRTTLVEEKARVIEEEKNTYSADPEESSSQDVSVGENATVLGETSAPEPMSIDEFDKQATKFDESVGEGVLEGSSSEEEDDEEEAQEEGAKAVEWNEDDEKNLMDLGDSELERNRRLESLILRRRSRKYKINAEGSLMDIDGAVPGPVAPVFVSRNNPFHVSGTPEGQIPGSAPSILLPRRNPFDLPYDPQEEKPNLMADSFHQEFTAAHQKEMFFCRHESFTLGTSFPFLGMQDQYDGQEHFRGHSDRGDDDTLAEHIMENGGGTLRRTLSVTDLVTEGGQISDQEASKPEQHISGRSSKTDVGGGKIGSTNGMEQNAINHQESESNPSTSSGDDEQMLRENGTGTSGNLQSAAFKFPDISNSPASNPLPLSIPKARTVLTPSFDSSHSIASDLQVEVSEVGSPPLTIDESASSSSDGDSYTYDGDAEKEITSGSDDMWGVSPHAPTQRFKEHEMTFDQVSYFGQEESVNGGAFGVKEEHGSPTTSIISPVSFPKAEVTQENESCSLHFNQDSSGGFKVAVDEVGESGLPSYSDAAPPGNMTEGTHSMEESVAHTPHESHMRESQESSSSPVKFAEEMNISYDMDDLVQANDDMEDSKSIKLKGGGNEESAAQEVSDKLPKPANQMNLESSASVGNDSLNANEKSAVVVNVSSGTDDAVVHVDNRVEDLEPNEGRDDGTKKLVTEEVVGNQSKLPQESTSESSRYAESSSEKVAADCAVLKSVTPDKEAKELKYIGNAEEDSGNAAKLEGGQDNSSQDKGEDSTILAENHQVERSRREVGVFEANQTFSDPNMLQQQELIVEQVQDHSSSSSSPKSVLPDRIPADDRSSSDFNEQRPIYVSESDVEESAVRINLLGVLLPARLGLPEPRHDGQLIEEPSNALGMLTAEADETHNINATETEEDLRSSETIKILAEASANNEEAAEISRHLEIPIELIEGSSANVSEHEAKTNQPGQGEERATLDAAPKEKGENSTSSPEKLTEQGNIISSLHNPLANEKDNVTELSKPTETGECSKTPEDPTTDKLTDPKLSGESTNQ